MSFWSDGYFYFEGKIPRTWHLDLKCLESNLLHSRLNFLCFSRMTWMRLCRIGLAPKWRPPKQMGSGIAPKATLKTWIGMLQLEIQTEKDVRDTGMVLKVSHLRIKFPVVDGTTCQNSIDARHCWMGQDFIFSLQRIGKGFLHLCSWDPLKSANKSKVSHNFDDWRLLQLQFKTVYSYIYLSIFVISLSHNSVLAGLNVHTFLLFVNLSKLTRQIVLSNHSWNSYSTKSERLAVGNTLRATIKHNMLPNLMLLQQESMHKIWNSEVAVSTTDTAAWLRLCEKKHALPVENIGKDDDGPRTASHGITSSMPKEAVKP